eukprot:g1339.t1
MVFTLRTKMKVLNIVALLIVSQYMVLYVVNGKDLTCKAGEGVPSGKIFTSGDASQCSGLSKITTWQECKLAAEYNRKNNIDKNVGFGGRLSWSDAPPGCYYRSGYKYIWNDYTKSTKQCSNHYKCICKTKTCIKCPINTYSEGGTNPICNRKLCQLFVPYHHTMKRFFSLIEVFFQKPLRMQGAGTAQTSFLEMSIKDKPKQNVVENLISNLKSHVKLFKNEIDAPMKHLEESIDKHSSFQEKSSGNVGISEEAVERIVELATQGLKLELKRSKDQIAILKGESKAAASTTETLKNQMTRLKGEVKNKAAASTTETLKNQITLLKGEVKSKAAASTTETLKNQMTRLKGEVKNKAAASTTETLKNQITLLKGEVKSNAPASATKALKKQITLLKDEVKSKTAASQTKTIKRELQSSKERIASLQHKVNSQLIKLLKDNTNSPQSIDNKKVENIVNQHITTLKDEINHELNDAVSDDTIKMQLAKRQKYRLGKGNKGSIKSIGSIMRSKPKTNSKLATCTGGSEFEQVELAKQKNLFCKGYKHLDLSSPEVKNIAMHYLNNDLTETILNNKQHMNALASALRYDVQDTSCPSKLFDSKDISIQQVNMDTLGNEKEWVAVVNLNTQDTNGYLQSELPYCKARDYLIAAKAQVKVYVDDDGCCDGLKDYKQCVGKVTCENKLVELKDKNQKHYSKDVVLTGTQYEVKSSYDVNRRRRRLLVNAANTGC